MSRLLSPADMAAIQAGGQQAVRTMSQIMGALPSGTPEIYRGRQGATKIVRVPSQGTIALNTTGSVQTVKFVKPGRVTALYGQTKEATDIAAANVSVRILQGADRELVTDGSGAAFAPFLALFGTARNWWPLYADVTPGEVWQFLLKNESLTTAFTPDLLLAVWEEL